MGCQGLNNLHKCCHEGGSDLHPSPSPSHCCHHLRTMGVGIGIKWVPIWYEMGTKLTPKGDQVVSNWVATWEGNGCRWVRSWWQICTQLIAPRYRFGSAGASGTYRNGREMATLGKGVGVQVLLDNPFGSCRAVSHFTDFVEELHGMYRITCGTCTNFLQFT